MHRIHTWGRSALAVLAVFFVFSAFAQAQYNASISGTVLDPTGAVIPGAVIRLTNTGTNATQSATSSAEGSYRFSQLPPGTYTLNATLAGFTATSIPAFPLAAETPRSLDITLQAGAATETIEVSASTVPLLQNSDASIGATIGSEQVRRLPIFGSNPYELLRTAPGITGDGARAGAGNAVFLPNALGPGGSNSGIFQTENQTQIAANGQRTADNNYMIDGVSVNSLSHGGSAVVTPNQEAVESITVVSTSYDATDGRNTGAQIKTVSRSGTNEIHGSAYGLYAEPGLNSYQKWAGPQPGSLPQRVQNKQRSWIASLGGPVIKDKLFLFGSWQGFTQKQLSTATQGWVETQQYRQLVQTQRAGSTTSTILGQPGVQPRVIAVLDRGCADYVAQATNYPGQTTSTGAWCRRAGNGIDIGSPFGARGQYLPQTATGAAPAVGSEEIGGGFDGIPDLMYVQLATPNQQRGNQFNGRGDLRLGQKDVVTGSVFFTKLDSYTSANANSRPMGDVPFKPLNSAGTAIWIHTFSPTWLNEFRANFTRFKDNQIADGGGIVNYGIPEAHTEGLPVNQIQFGLPQGTGTSYAQNTYEVSDMLSHQWGSHNLRMGVSIRREQDNDDLVSSHVRPVYSFRGLWQLANDTPIFEGIAANPNTGGPPSIANHLRSEYYAAFAQHDWKVTPHFTLNTGLRYEIFTPLRNKDYQMLYPVLGTTPGRELADMVLRQRDRLWNYDFSGFSPKVGFAYTPAQFNSKMVLRGGFAMAYNHLDIALFNPAQLDNGPNLANYGLCCGSISSPYSGGTISYVVGTSNSATSYPRNPALATGTNAATGFPNPYFVGGVSTDVPVELYGAFPRTKQPYSYLFSLETQYELPGQIALTVGYGGSLGRHYARLVNQRFLYDTSNYKHGAVYQATTDSVQSYNGLNVVLNKRMSHGLQATISYTYSKALDQVSSGDYANSLANQTNPANNRTEYGPSDYDLRHRVTGTVNYELPHVKSGSSVVNTLINGWQLNSIVTWHTGFAFTPVTSNLSAPGANTAADTVNPTRPLAYFGGAGNSCSNDAFKNGSNFSRGATSYFNITPPPGGTKAYVPGIGRNSFRGPCYTNIDLSGAKEFAADFGDHHTLLRFQANLYNAFNILSLAPIRNGNADSGSNLGSPFFGYASSANSGRVIEFTGRIQF